jgi:hypothetical protein
MKIFLIILIHIFLCIFFFEYTIDDAYICFRYARNFAHGYGLVYNIDERVEGYSNFLWTLIIGILIKLGLDPLLSAKVLGILLNSINVYLTYFLFKKCTITQGIIENNITHNSIISAFLVATYPPFIVSSIHGLETSLFTFFLLVSTIFFVKSILTPYFQLLTSISLSFLCLTRHDGILFFFFSCIYYLIQNSIIKEEKEKEKVRHSFKTIFSFILPFVLIYGSYYILRSIYYSDIFPNTFYAKSGGTFSLAIRGLQYISWFLKTLGGYLFIILCFPVIFEFSQKFILKIFFSIILIRMLFHIYAGGSWGIEPFRFLIPIVPFVYIIFVEGIERIKKSLNLSPLFIYIAVILLFANNISFIQELKYVQYGNGLKNAHIPLGKWFYENTPINTKIGIDDAGAIAYYSQRYCIDMLGICDKHIGKLKGEFYKKFDTDYILSKDLDYIVLIGEKEIPEKNTFPLPNDEYLFNNKYFHEKYKHIKTYKFEERYYLHVFIKSV